MASSSSSSSRRITQISSQFCQAGSHASQPAEDQLPLSVQISNRHVHLNPAAVEKLFGPGYTFALHHPLVGIPREVFESLPPLARKLLGLEYAAKETVDMVNRNNGKTLAKLRVLAPFRDFVQIEVRAPPPLSSSFSFSFSSFSSSAIPSLSFLRVFSHTFSSSHCTTVPSSWRTQTCDP